jgi:phage terminase small subunit
MASRPFAGKPIGASAVARRSSRRRRRFRRFSGASPAPAAQVGAEPIAPADASSGLEDVTARAARLGVTIDKVLQEYAWIAFADLRHIVEWDPEGFHLKASEPMSEADAAPIQEIVADASGSRPYRVKLYDKKAALDAIARHLGMFPPVPKAQEEEQAGDPAEELREEIERRLARLAGETDPP